MQVYSPIHEGLAAPDGEDDAVDVVDWNGFDDHGFYSQSPVGVDEGIALRARRFGVGSCGVLGCKAQEGIGGEVEL